MVCCISVMASVRSCPLSTDIDVIENRGNSPTQAPRHVDSLWVDYLFDSAALDGLCLGVLYVGYDLGKVGLDGGRLCCKLWCLAEILVTSETTKPLSAMQTGVSEFNLDDDLLSHGETPHYHRRCIVSLLSSGWDQVVPMLYGRQEILCIGPLR